MSPRAGSVVTIGTYDGLHLGHRQVVYRVCQLARERGLRSVVVTFDRHPASVVRPDSAPLQLTDLPQRLELLRATGVDYVHVIEFTPERAEETAEEFVGEMLVGELGARVVVVGDDFHFGKDQAGNVDLLEKLGAEDGFSVEPYPLVPDPVTGEPVSSTRIRALVAGGDLAEAARLLGRSYEVRGRVSGEAVSSGDGGGATEARVAVPSSIVLPPAGSYEASLGAVGSDAGDLRRGRVVVPARAEPGAACGLELLASANELPPAGAELRVVFSAADGPRR